MDVFCEKIMMTCLEEHWILKWLEEEDVGDQR